MGTRLTVRKRRKAGASDPRRDPFIDSLIRNMPPEEAALFEREHLEAIVKSLDRTNTVHRHFINWRATLSLYFTRLYVVLLIGRDRRQQVSSVEVERRTGARGASVFLLGLLGLVALLGFVTILLYVVKEALDIDLVSGWSPRELFDGE